MTKEQAPETAKTQAAPATKPADAPKPQAQIDKEAIAAAEAAKTPAPAKEADKDHIPAPGEPGYTPPETVPDEVAALLDAATGGTTSDNDEEHGKLEGKVREVVEEVLNEEDEREYRGAAVRVKRLTDMVGLRDKKDEFTIYGYGGVSITLGDLRGLLSKYKD